MQLNLICMVKIICTKPIAAEYELPKCKRVKGLKGYLVLARRKPKLLSR